MGNPLQDFKDCFARDLYGMTAGEAIEEGICISCKEPALEKCTTELSRKEYHISGLCDPCFQEITLPNKDGW